MEVKEKYFLSKRWGEAQFPYLIGHRNYVNIRYVRIHNLHNSTLQTSVSLLIKKGILAKSNDTYEITDVFFKEWIRLMTG